MADITIEIGEWVDSPAELSKTAPVFVIIDGKPGRDLAKVTYIEAKTEPRIAVARAVALAAVRATLALT